MLYIGRDWSSTRLNDVVGVMRRVLGRRRVDTLVDVGCAGGELTQALRPFARRVLGIDPWDARVAGALAAHGGLSGLEFRVASADDLPAGTADVATCLEVLEHMPREEAPAFLSSLEGAVGWCALGCLGFLVAFGSLVILLRELSEESARRRRGEVRGAETLCTRAVDST